MSGGVPIDSVLVKRLRERSVFLFPHHGESRSYDADLMHEAADAIEELQAQLMFSNDAAKEIAAKVPKWISVTERLPEEDGKYLTAYKLNTIPPTPWIEACWFAKNLRKVDKYDFPKKKPGFYNNDSEYGYFEVSGITHWMPLPEPPKEE